MTSTMASQRVQTQLSRALALNAAGVVAPPPPAITILPIPGSQPALPVYTMGYRAGTAAVQQHLPARPAGGRGTNHLLSGVVGVDNLHPLLFQSEPAPDGLAGVPVPVLVDTSTSQVVTGADGTPLRYFSHLPRWVEHNVSGMLIELWLRLDSRVEMRDIVNRINLPPGKNPSKTNTYTMRADRFREIVGVTSFRPSRQLPKAFEVAVFNDQSREQVLLNTCMIVDFPNQRMFKPVLTDKGLIKGYIDSRLPLDYFLRGFPTPIPLPSDRQQVVLALRHRLQTLGIHLNLGNQPQTYERLPPNLLPTWFHKGFEPENAPSIHQIDNFTHNKWIAELFKQYPGAVNSRSPTRPAPGAQPTPMAFQTPTALVPTAYPAQTGPSSAPPQYTFPQAGQTPAAQMTLTTFQPRAVSFPTAHPAQTGRNAAPLRYTPTQATQTLDPFHNTLSQTTQASASYQNTLPQAPRPTAPVQNTFSQTRQAAAPLQSTRRQAQSTQSTLDPTFEETQSNDIPIFTMPAGDVAPVEPVSQISDLGGYSYYVEPEHRESEEQQAARKAQLDARREREAQEKRETELAVQEAMRNFGWNELRDY